MIGKLREALNVKSELEALNSELVKNKELVTELSNTFKNELADLKEIKKYQTDFLNKIKSEVDSVKSLKEDIKRELDQFTAINKGLAGQILAKFEKETVDFFSSYNQSLKLDKDNYEKLKEDVEMAGRNLALFNQEIVKLAQISQQLKKQDFELSQFASKIFSEDKNKLALMKRIDDLERLMARMKRGNR